MTFTPEQQDILQTICRILETMARTITVESERKTRSYIAALHLALVKKGVVTQEDLTAAQAEIEAGLAVEDALNPEIQAALDEMNRLLRQEDGPPPDPAQGS